MKPARSSRARDANRKPRARAIGEDHAEGRIADFPIVGIGASAGGLAAFEAFFSGMPPGPAPGMALVLVQHLAPDHESRLGDLIRRHTEMRVFEVEDGMTVETNCVYIIPPARAMALRKGRLRLLEPTEPRGHRLPIDFFFRSLAEDRNEKAICVVLSGTGSDGTLGVREVKGRGGLVMAQDPDTTEYGGMPRSAIATGAVDQVLPAAEMPDRLMRYVEHPVHSSHAGQVPATTMEGEEEALKQIFRVLHGRTGHDFKHYKRNSIRRRIERRMAVQQVDGLEQYAGHLARASEEADALFRDLLIGVTRFFRDPEAFEALREKWIPWILESKPPGSTIRVWVPGCSSGEEAYSIAIVLREGLSSARLHAKLQVFATDIDGRAIAAARAGTYPASIADDVSAERLERFFSPGGGGSGYRVRKSIRDVLVFSEQDLISDPPFSRLDLISCRNVLIYMGTELQRKLLPLFHYALNPGGMLLLGSSESVASFKSLFTTCDRSAKLYQKKEDRPGAPRRAPGYSGPTSSHRRRKVPDAGPPERSGNGAERSLRELVERELLEHHAPVAALVDAAGELLYLHGRSGRFLEPAPGEVGMNILKMARDGLRQELTIALHQTATRKDPARRYGLSVRADGGSTTVDLTVRALSTPSRAASEHTLFLVILDERAPVTAFARPAPPKESQEVEVGPGAEESEGARPGADREIARLEEELRAKEEYLEAVQEEMQTSNEELRSSIEELQSTNEELQSTNEELETSKEELQSVNEELATINTELETKVTDLSRVENDMNNLLAGTGIGTIFVDHELKIQRFTPAATELLNLIDSDVGRPVGHLTSRLRSYDRLAADTEAVLDTLVPREVEVETEGGTWYLLRMRPYRTLENVVEGAVITFTDITEVKEARATVREAAAQRRLAVVVNDASDAVTMQDLEGRIQAWNPGATRVFGWAHDEAVHMTYGTLVPEEARDETQAMLERLARGGAPEPLRTSRVTKDGRRLTVWVTATALIDESGKVYAFATTERAVEPDAKPGTKGRDT